MSEYVNVVEIFGENVFNDAVMQARLPKKVYKELKQTMEEGKARCIYHSTESRRKGTDELFRKRADQG